MRKHEGRVPAEGFLLVIVFLVPLAIYKGTYNQVLIKLSLTQVLLLVSFILWMGRYYLDRLRLVRTPLDLPILLFLFLALLSLTASKYKWAGATEVYRLVTYFLLYFVTVNTVRDRNSLNRVTFFWLLSTGLACLYGLWQHFFEGMSPIRSSFGNANFFAAYLVLVLPVTVALFISSLYMGRASPGSHRPEAPGVSSTRVIVLRRLRIASLTALLALIVTSLLLASSRGAWLGMTIGLIFFGWLRLRARWAKRIFPALLFVILIIFSVTTPLLLQKKPIREELERGTLGLRVLIWEGVLRMIASHPFMGTGIGAFYITYPEYRLPEYFLNPHAVDSTAHAHNEFLEIGAEMGILGLGTFLWILVTFFRKAVALVSAIEDRYRRTLVIGLISGVAGMMATNLVGVNLRFPSSAIFFWLTLGLVMGQLPYRQKGEANYHLRIYSYQLRAALFALSLVASIWVGWQVVAKPFLANFHFQRGINYRKVEDWERAISEYKRAVEFDPYFVKVYYRLGFAYVAKGDLDKAISAYQKVISLAPDFARVHANLAFIYKQKRELDKAKESYQKALKLNPYDEALQHEQQ